MSDTDIYSAPEGEGLPLLRQGAHSRDESETREGREPFRLGVQLRVDSVRSTGNPNPIDLLFRAYSSFSAFSLIQHREDDEFFRSALDDLRTGIEILRAEAVG
jgi:hypothetical protein